MPRARHDPPAHPREKGFFYSIKENEPIFCAFRSNMGAKANGRWESDRPQAVAVSARELGAGELGHPPDDVDRVASTGIAALEIKVGGAAI